MPTPRLAASLIVSLLLLAGCGGSDDAVSPAGKLDPKGFAQASSTLPLAGAAGLANDDPSVVPDDDGGELCDALHAAQAATDGDEPATVAEAAAVLIRLANTFTSDVLPHVPDQLASDAQEFVDAMSAAGRELSGYEDQQADPSELRGDRSLVALGKASDLLSPGLSDTAGEYRYSNHFTAWMAEPCGPKALTVDPDAGGFQSIAANI